MTIDDRARIPGSGGRAMARDWSGGVEPAGVAGDVSRRRLLGTFCGLLAALALLLAGAATLGSRLRPPLERVPVATYAARAGIALPPDPTATPPAVATATATGGDGRCAVDCPPGPIANGRTGRGTPTVARGTLPTPGASPGRGTVASSPEARSGASASTSPSSVTVPPALAGSPLVPEVVSAYLRAWEVWADACLTLDPAPLASAFAQPELDRARGYVDRLRAGGQVLRLDAEHRLTVLELDGETALLLDEVTDRSVYLDPTTRRPLPRAARSAPSGPEQLRCLLRRTDAGWRVIELVWER